MQVTKHLKQIILSNLSSHNSLLVLFIDLFSEYVHQSERESPGQNSCEISRIFHMNHGAVICQ